jgi:N-acetylmuramoyl-L-alanine amidase
VLVLAIIATALAAAGGIWWKFHNQLSQPVAAAASLVTPQPAAAAPPPAANSTQPVSMASVLPDPTPAPQPDSSRGLLPQITGIRHWESEDSSTVVIDLQDQVQYEVHRLSSPERIYFDLHDTVLAQGFNGKTIEVGDELLARIRVAQPFPGVSRVVLETKNVSNFSVGLEPNPYRLSIEISRGSQRLLAARISTT